MRHKKHVFNNSIIVQFLCTLQKRNDEPIDHDQFYIINMINKSLLTSVVLR